MKAAPIACLVFLLGCGSPGPQEMELASVAGTPILLSRYQTEYVGYLGKTGLPDEDLRRSAYLNRMIGVELIIRESRDGGIEDTDAFLLEQERFRQKALIEGWLADTVYDTIRVGAGDEAAMFQRINTQMTARHLFANTLQEAEHLAARLQAGESFQDLAREVFADPVLASTGGLVGVFGFDEMDAAFEDAAYDLEIGGVSGPVKTVQGYSVIKLEDRFTKPVMTEQEFASRRPQIREYVTRRKKSRARRTVLRALLDGADPRLNLESAEAFLGSTSVAIDPETESSISKLPLISFRDGAQEVEWTVEEFVELSRTTSDEQRARVDSIERLRAMVEGLVARHLMTRKATELGLGSDSRVQDTITAAESEWIYEQAYNTLLDRVFVPEEAVEAHYSANKAEYRIEERVSVSEIVANTKSEAQSLKDRLDSMSFEELARRFSERPQSAANGGDLGFLTSGELGPWAKEVFSASQGTVIGPLAAAGKYILLKIGAHAPSRVATLEEADPQIRAELARPLQQSHLREHVQELRSRYSVRILVDSIAAIPIGGAVHVSS